MKVLKICSTIILWCFSIINNTNWDGSAERNWSLLKLLVFSSIDKCWVWGLWFGSVAPWWSSCVDIKRTSYTFAAKSSLSQMLPGDQSHSEHPHPNELIFFSSNSLSSIFSFSMTYFDEYSGGQWTPVHRQLHAPPLWAPSRSLAQIPSLRALLCLLHKTNHFCKLSDHYQH